MKICEICNKEFKNNMSLSNHQRIHPNSKSKYENKIWLREQYILKKNSSNQIGENCGVSGRTILNWLNRFKIPIRKRTDFRFRNKEWMEEQYFKENKTQKQIADICDVDKNTIKRWMKKLKIKTRWKDRDPRYYNKKWLIQKYWNENISLTEIGFLINKCPDTISNWMKSFGIKRRNTSESLRIKEYSPHDPENRDYQAVHAWMRRQKTKPKLCEICHKEKKLELSSKDHKYTQKLDEYRFLCKSCHIEYDKKMNPRKRRP